MKLLAPKYYKKFKCAADACRHSCCVGWEIDVDEDTLALYERVEGEIGERIRESIERCPDGAHFKLCEGERCALLDERGLCRIISALGEGALCDICREHPRFYNTVGTHLECGLGAACEVAAALILAEEDYRTLEHIEGEDEITPVTGGNFDVEAARAALYTVLSDRERPIEERFAQLASVYALHALPRGEELRALLCSLEYLDQGHRAMLASLVDVAPPDNTECEQERFFAYLVYRHASAADSKEAFRAAVGMALLLTRLFGALMHTHTPTESAVILSEEMEYSRENTEALLFAVQNSEKGA